MPNKSKFKCFGFERRVTSKVDSEILFDSGSTYDYRFPGIYQYTNRIFSQAMYLCKMKLDEIHASSRHGTKPTDSSRAKKHMFRVTALNKPQEIGLSPSWTVTLGQTKSLRFSLVEMPVEVLSIGSWDKTI